MNKGLLITRPNHDLATTYLYQWCIPLIKEAEASSSQVLDLSGKKANQALLISYIKKNKPGIVFLNGHGGPDFICGYDNEVLVGLTNCEQLLSKCIVYARSCESGLELGPYCIQKGTIAFIGYSKKYVVGYSEEKRTRPLNDDVARLFLEPSNLIPFTLIKGNRVKIAYAKSQELMQKNINFMLSSEATPDQRDAATYLWRNKKYQVALGNLEASI